MPYIGKQLSNGNYLKLDDISSSFNSSTTTFSLTNGGSAYYPGSEFSILVSVGGVIQEPESAYQINNDQITFANAPTAQDSFFCVVLGDAIGINVPGNNTVNGAQMAKPFNYDGGLLYLNDTDNRVGINSTSPQAALDVVGDLKVSGVLNPNDLSTFYNLRVSNNLTVEGTTTTLDTDLIGVDRIEVGANSNTVVGVAITQSGTADIINLFDGVTEVLTVTDGGKVGIGLTNPSSTSILHLRTSANHNLEFEESAGNLRISALNDARSTNEVLQFAASKFNFLTGNVGIGTVTPGNTLHLGGTQGVGARWHNYTSGNSAYLTLESGDKFQSNVGGSGEHAWVSAGGRKMTLTNAGVLGIGTGDNGLNAKSLESRNTGLSTPSMTWGAGNPGQIFRNEGSELKFGLTAYSPYAYFIQANTSGSGLRQITLNPMGGSVAIGVTDPQTDAGLIARYQNTFAPTLTWNAAKGHTLRNEGSELNFGLSNSSPHSYFIQGRTNGSAAKQIVLNPLGGNVGVGTDNPAQTFTSYTASGYPILANGTSNGIGLGGNGAIVFGTYNVAAYAKGILDASELEFKINGTPKITIDTSGRLRVANTNFSANGDGDTVIIGTTSGTRGMTIVSGNNNTGNIFFGDDGDNDVGGVVYNHNGNTLNFRANGSTRATVSGTAFWVDDGTNARLKLAPDSATLNMIISTTTNNGSYCNLLYGAADHIFKYGGTETARLSTAGNYTITGEFASAQDYPVIKPTLDLNFAATKALDPRIEYYRYGPGSYIDGNGKVVLVGEDVPRFDHDPDTGECKGLLVEGERRNYFPNGVRPGDKFNHSKAGTFTENTTETTAPDGSYTATKWTFTNNDPYLYHQQTLNAGVTYTMSMWVKAGTNMAGDWLQFRIGGAPYSAQADSIIPADGTWRRITHTRTIGGSNETNANIGFEPQTSPSGNPASGDVIYIWGAQLESGSTASSFIPTYGYTQARGPDVVQITGEEFSDFYNQIEGTIFLSASYDTDARAASIVTIDDTSAYANYTEVGYRSGGASSGNLASYIRTTAGNDQYYKNWVSSATQGNEFKIALGYKDDNYASSANGSTVHTDTSGTTHKTYDRLKFSEVHTVGHGGVGHYRRLMYYPKRITNTQLVTLTS